MAPLAAFELYRFFHAREAETLALRGVSLMLEARELVAVVGPSGSGKSSLLACLAGLDEPDGGHVEVLGKRVTRQPEAERARIRVAAIGMLMQGGNLFPTLTVTDNIMVPMQLANCVDTNRVDMLLSRVGLAERRHARPGQLSGGELARAGLAVALATRPRVLLADEPTGEVDALAEAHILELLQAERATGTAILIATHSLAIGAQADRVIRLRDGRIVDG